MLTARSDFLAVQGKGEKWLSRGLILQFKKNDTNDVRIGFTVSKKVHKSAVMRNRIRRRLKSAAADILPNYAQGGYDYVLVGRKNGNTYPYDTLKSDLKWCLKKTGCYDAKKDT